MGRKQNQSAEAVWRDRLARYQQSNVSIPEFCREEGVSNPSFYKWRKRLQAAEAKSVSRSPNTVVTEPFVPVNVSASTLYAELELPNGVRIRVPASNAQTLRVVILTAYEVAREGSVDA